MNSFTRVVATVCFALLAGAASAAPPAPRTIEVVMDDGMRFTPSAIEAATGETLRIVARNTGRMDHELVIGSEKALREHAQAMQHHGGHAHSGGAAVRVAPGASGELLFTAARPGVLKMACLIPGHYEAGMRGTLTVTAAKKPAARASAHQH